MITSRLLKCALVLIPINSFAGGLVNHVVGGAVAGTIIADSIEDSARQSAPPLTISTSGNSLVCGHPSDNGCNVYCVYNTIHRDYDQGLDINLSYAEYVSYKNHEKLSKIKVLKVTRIYDTDRNLKSVLIEFEVK